MPSIVTDRPFNTINNYPTIGSDYAYTLAAMKNISFDIWLASHASQFNLHQKHKAGAAYNPAAFIDQAGYMEALQDLQQQFEEQTKKTATHFSEMDKNWFE